MPKSAMHCLNLKLSIIDLCAAADGLADADTANNEAPAHGRQQQGAFMSAGL